MKKLSLVMGLFVLGVVARPGQANAQSITTRVVVSATAAPVLVKPDPAMTPLRVAKEGSVLNVIASEGEWYRIEFQDPQFGRRVGYVEKRHVSVMAAPAQEAIDLTVPESRPAQNGFQTQQQQINQTASHPSADSSAGREMSVTQPTDQALNAPNSRAREGFWFNVGLGFGSLGCDSCTERFSGASGGLALGGTISDRVLLGVGTTSYAKPLEDGRTLSVGTLDARLRFYPSVTSGFFINGGIGLGSISVDNDGDFGVGVMLGLGWDIRVSRKVSLTPFWNGSAVRSSFDAANFGQIGLGVTIH